MTTQSIELDTGPMTSDTLPSYNVERKEFAKHIRSAINTISSGKEHQLKIINFIGLPGSGKSFVALNAFHAYRRSHLIIWLDFDTNQKSREESITNWSNVRRAINTIPTLKFIPDRITFSDGAHKGLESVNVLFHAENLEHYDQKPLLVILDHLDGLNYWPWLQQVLLQPLLDQQWALVLCNSQRALRWNSLRLADRCERHEVGPFGRNEIEQLLNNYNLGILAPLVQEVTQGYPLRIFYLLQLLQAEGKFDLPNRRVSVDKLRTKLSVAVFDVIFHAGIVRNFNVQVINELLSVTLEGWKEQEQRIQFLQRHVYPAVGPYIKPYKRAKSNRISPELRYAIRDTLIRDNPTLFEQTCRTLSTIYERLFLREPSRSREAFLEWAFFSLELVEQKAMNRQEWLNNSNLLLGRHSFLDLRLALSLHKDGELAGKLRKLNLFQLLIEQIQERVGETIRGEPLNATEFSIYKRWVLERLSQQPTLNAIYSRLNFDLMSLLSIIEDLGDDFASNDLYAKLSATNKLLSHMNVVSLLNMLYNSGLVAEGKTPSHYSLPASTRTLLRASYSK